MSDRIHGTDIVAHKFYGVLVFTYVQPVVPPDVKQENIEPDFMRFGYVQRWLKKRGTVKTSFSDHVRCSSDRKEFHIFRTGMQSYMLAFDEEKALIDVGNAFCF
jgi:hypothetical protein